MHDTRVRTRLPHSINSINLVLQCANQKFLLTLEWEKQKQEEMHVECKRKMNELRSLEMAVQDTEIG